MGVASGPVVNSSNPLGISIAPSKIQIAPAAGSIASEAMNQVLTPTDSGSLLSQLESGWNSGVAELQGISDAQTAAVSAATEGTFGSWASSVQSAVSNSGAAIQKGINAASTALSPALSSIGTNVESGLQSLGNIPATIEDDLKGLTAQWGASLTKYASNFAIEAFIVLIIIVALVGLLHEQEGGSN